MKELEYTTQSVPKGKRFCTICGEVKRLHYFEGDSTHCSACCEKMLHTRLHRWCIPVLLAVLLVAAASVYLSVFTVPYCIDLVKAEFAMRDKRLDDACTVYASAVNSASERNAALQAFGKKNADGTYTMPDMTLFEAGTRTWTKYLQTYAALYSEYEAAALVQSSLNTDVANTVPFVASLNEAQEAYNNTLAQAQLIEAQYAEEESEQTLYEKVIADLTAYAKQSDSHYIKGYVEMYKARATAYFKPDAFESTKAYYEKMLEYLPDEFMAAYLAEAEAAQRAGNYEAAIEAYEKLLQKNHNYTQAYSAIAKAAFCAGNTEKVQQILDRYAQNDATRLQLEMWLALRSDDLEAAEKVRARANKTIKVDADKVFNEMLAAQTVSADGKTTLMDYVDFALYDAAYALVKGDAKEAFALAYETAYNYVYYYIYITNDGEVITQPFINMTMLCANLSGDEEAIQATGQFGSCTETTSRIIDGELTARDVFVEGKAEDIL